MSIIAKKGESNFEPVPAGTYVARCYQMIDIGTIPETYMGEPKMTHKVRLGFELSTELKVFKEGEGAKPWVISQEFTLSMHEKANLRKILEGWRGKGFTDDEAEAFDITALLGVPAMISVIHKVSVSSGKTNAKIASISRLPKGIECPPQVNPFLILEWDKFNVEVFDKLPDFLKEKIKGSREYTDMMGITKPQVVAVETEVNPDDIPF